MQSVGMERVERGDGEEKRNGYGLQSDLHRCHCYGDSIRPQTELHMHSESRGGPPSKFET